MLAAGLGAVGGVVLTLLISQGLAWRRRRKLAVYQYVPGGRFIHQKPIFGLIFGLNCACAFHLQIWD